MVLSSVTGSSYTRKFGAGMVVVVLAVAAACANLYVSLAAQIPAGARTDLISGIAIIVGALLVGLLLVATWLSRSSPGGLSVLAERAEQMEQGDLSVELETERDDELGQVYRAFAAMRDALRERVDEAEEQNRHLQQRAGEFSEVMAAIGNGDLSRRLDEDVGNEAMAQLARDFNDMMDDLEETIGEVYTFTDEVSTAADVLARQTEASMRASARIHRAAQDIAIDGGELAPSEQFEYIERKIDETENGVEPANELGVEIEETLDAIHGLSGQMDRIDEISEFISDVANETNMLALNAGIEASKVEQGDVEGFQAVADEVKSLAEETKESAAEIETITGDIRGETSEAVNSLLRQQAALLSMMDEQVEDLSDASEDLRLTLTRLNVADPPEVQPEPDPVDLEPKAED